MITTIDGIPVYDALISDEECGMMKVSLVDDPAVMSNFMAFDNKKRQLMYAVADEEKRRVFGVLMRADFPIYRCEPELGEFYVIYKADTIRRMAEKYLQESRQNNVNLMHADNTDVEGVNMVQYFIKDSAKGISPEGFDVADGSLFAEYHVTNDDVWGAIKEGTFKGFSLEGVFCLAPEQDAAKVEQIVDELDGQFKNEQPTKSNKMAKIKKIKEMLRAALMAFGSVTTDKGVIAWDGEEDLKAGDGVFIEDQDGNRVPAEDGEYVTEDKKTIVVVDGKVAEIKDPEAEVDSNPAPENVEEAPAEAAKMGSVESDKGVISWNGEEDLKAGDEVFVEGENGEKVAAPDGEYVIADGKVIVVADGKVAEIKDAEAEVVPAPKDDVEAIKAENASLKEEVEKLREQVKCLSERPLAEPAHEVVSASAEVRMTGNKGLDRLAKLMNAR